MVDERKQTPQGVEDWWQKWEPHNWDPIMHDPWGAWGGEIEAEQPP